ncbi:lipase family protein [Mycobacterium sp. SMC-8]|uniref:lipase family protein n=1 Tax=Mycobacterium sp. SMC-8 TaxID=2857060 RepID=UPI0021B46DA3|nr:lipase family protein [Mycobacterium sp. SMC-8]UXA12760.1 lipase family protein [Mycobacterium sp. SMC-8]
MTTADPLLPSAPIAAPIVVPLPDVPADVWQSRGQIVHKESYDPPLADPDSVLGGSWRAVYRSVSGLDGGEREVSGAFFLPRGTPPVGGWPVVSFAHGTTGIGTDCGPSYQPDLQGYSPIVESLLDRKYAVALSDYEGLGQTGSHQYLEQRTAAFNTIDAVRALRELSPTVSTRWAAIGYSQGGQAVWAANELNPYYGGGLELVGSVALAPAANVTATADLIWSGSLTEEQLALFPLFIVGLGRYNPDLDERAFLHGSTEAQRKRLSHCAQRGEAHAAPRRYPAPIPWKTVVDQLSGTNETTPDSPRDVAELRDAMRKIALPQRPLDRPMLVVSGAVDSLVFAQWVRTAVADSCSLGGHIEYRQIPSADHANVLWRSASIVARWVAARFDGVPAPSNCPVERSGGVGQ